MALLKKLTYAIIFVGLLFVSSKTISADDCPVCTSESSCQQRISCLSGQKKSLSAQIELIDTKITLTKTQIRSTQDRIDKLTDSLSSVSGKITNIEDSLNQVSAILVNRISKTYIIGRSDPLLYILSATDFADFWQRYEYLRIVQKRDKELMIQMAASKRNYKDQKQILEDKKKQVEILSSQLKSQKILLDSQNKEKQALLVTTQKQLDQAVAQLAAFQSFVSSRGGAGILANQTKCDDWGCYYNQRDSQWGGNSLNHTGYTLADSGCLITSMAMVITHYGHRDVNPQTINVNPANFAIYYPAYLNYSINAGGSWSRSSISRSQMDEELNAGRPLVVGIGTGPSHFVVIVSGSNGNYIMNDPYVENGSKISFTSKYSLGSISEVDKVIQN
ncbi:C39 family peptidase [Candidatus Microgenomates bacterium]|nr:C39 family peptidase [Candidatus Microgenomates bacterium]